MASTYSSFLQSPSASYLADDASLHYITTTTSISEPTAILKHLQAQAKQVTKKDERVLNAVESSDGLFLETETTLQFNTGGGAYLPAMDQNLLDEKLVTFPLLHVVSFDANQKIKQIRLHWDQGTLLKQVEAIGRTGRNWPIRDGKAQIDAITKSLKASGGAKPSSTTAPPTARNANEVVINQHKRGDSKSTITRDPQELFNPRDPNASAGASYDGPKLAPRASAKPAPREYGELFAGGDSPSAAGAKVRSPSPSKADGVVFKSGAGKHYTGNRLFDENEPAAVPPSPERKKTYGQKYQHFAFGDGEDAPERKGAANGTRNSKAQPTFSFEDFATPMKYQQKTRPDNDIHWGADDPPSPPQRPIVHAARKDADTHFQLADASSPAIPKPQPNQSSYKAGELYHDPVAEEDADVDPVKPASRGTTTSVDNARRGNDFAAHYQMTDSPAASSENARPSSRGTRSDMAQNWSFDAPPPERKIYKTAGDGMGSRKGAANIITGEGPEKQIYKTAGDGMGGRKGAGGRSWGFGDESDPESQADIARGRKTRA